MIFNENLVLQYTGIKKDLAKQVLFNIDQDIRIDSAITNNMNDLSGRKWKEDILGDVQEIIVDLLARNVIAANNYEGNHSRYKLLRPIRVHSLTEVELTDEFIDDCRMPFFHNYCRVSNRKSSKKEVRKHLQLLLENNTEINKDLLPLVFKDMVDKRLKTNKDHVPMILNFINAYEDPDYTNKDLLDAYEEYTSDDRKKSNFL